MNAHGNRASCDKLPSEIDQWWYCETNDPDELAELIEAYVQKRLGQQERKPEPFGYLRRDETAQSKLAFHFAGKLGDYAVYLKPPTKI